jgi:hypothetical protein
MTFPHLRHGFPPMKLSPLLALPVCFSVLLALGAGASAQGGGFHAGEVFIYGWGVQSPGYSGAGVLRVDPATGAGSVLTPTWGTFEYTGTMAFDPYRQRLLLSTAITGTNPSPVNYLWAADGAGNLQNISAAFFPAGAGINDLAPTRDGRVYFTIDDGGGIPPIRWIDAANQLHVLYDSDGVTPMLIDGTAYYHIDGMIHDPGTNALFVASITPAPGFPQGAVNVRKLPLSADGSRVIGPVGNATFEVSPLPWGATSGETPRGWSYGPDGKLVLVILTIDAHVLPRMLLVDPVTSAISVWGSNGDSNPGPGGGVAWSTTNGGAYTSALNKVLVVDHWNTKLRAYAPGSAGGAGTVVTSSPASWGPGGYYLNVTAVPPDACSGGWIPYGVGLKGKGDLVPKLTGAGCAEPGSAITLNLGNAVGGASSALFVGLSSAALPFKGGTFRVGALLLTLNLPLGGTPGLAGAGTLTLPTSLPALPALTGTSIFLQGACADAAAVQGVALTQGLELEIG